MTLDKQIRKTDKMVKRVMAAHAPPIHLADTRTILRLHRHRCSI
jgi:hypothetical protein